jgi:hypothetical protein
MVLREIAGIWNKQAAIGVSPAGMKHSISQRPSCPVSSRNRSIWKRYRCEVQMNHAASLLSCYHGVVEAVVCEPLVALDARVPQ